MKAVRIISWIARIALMATMVLGLLFWITQISFIGIHMLLGLTGVLSLLVLGTMAVSTRGIRLLGAGSIVYALMVPAFGLTQSMILVGNLHWLIQTAHLLVGIGAMVLTQVIEKRYRHLRKAVSGEASPRTTAFQATR